MEKADNLASSHPAKAYIALMKPGIIMGNGITAVGGFALASRGHFDFWLFVAMFFGLSFIIGSACAFNNYIDRDADKKMGRTQNRALAKGTLPHRNALFFASFIGLLGTLLLAFYVNTLTTLIALCGFVIYVFAYSFMKYRSTHATLVGSIAGAVPPVVGYCAVSQHFDLGAVLLFFIIALWQMPHFYAIAIYRREEYAAASIPVLPVKEGIAKTKIQMVIYVAAYFIASVLPTLFGYTGMVYLSIAVFLGSVWLFLSLQGFKAKNDALWARKMFLFSLVIVTVLCSALVAF